MRSSAKFNAIVFEEAIHQKFAGNVKGYAFVIADENGFVAKVSGGYAQAPGDGNVPMKTSVASCIGSVSKMLSGIALLNLFDKHQLKDASVQEQLDTAIWKKLPEKWRDSFPDRNIDKIPYRQLLQHKSGFLIGDNEAENNAKGTKMSYVLSEGVNASDMGKREYNNFNFAILMFLIPAIAYPDATEDIHQKYRHLDVNEYSKHITPEYGKLYGKYMHEVIFPKTVEDISPTCTPQDALPRDQYAKYYSSEGDRSGGVINSDFCRPQGGWYISAQDLAIFARTFAFTNQYIGPTTKKSLYDPATEETRDDRLIYKDVITHREFEQETGQKAWPYHGGTQEGYRAMLVSLPYGYYGVGMINSPEFASGDLAQAIIDACYDATRGQPISLAKHGLSEAQYQKYASELGEHGSFPDWLDFYTVGSDVYVNVIFRPTQIDWLARHDLSGAAYQELYDKHVKHGPFKLKQVDSYVKQGQLRYAVVLVKGSSAEMPAYHGVTAEAHQQKFEDLTAKGYVPMNIAVSSMGDQRFYAAVYEKKHTAGLVVRSFLTADQYQALVNEQRQAGREIAYLKTYNHNGEIRYCAIFYGHLDRSQILRHDMSSAAYQQAFHEWVGKGFGLTMITGAASGNAHCYAAVWQQ